MPVDLTKYTPTRSFQGRFFDTREVGTDLGLTSADALFDWLHANNKGRSWSDTSAFTSGRVVFRGQSNANYGLSSSLFRLCSMARSLPVTEQSMVDAEQAILTTMRAEGLGRLMTDVELLQVLQHHGIPTRLVDVSVSAHEALFFAVDSNDSLPGRLFIVRLDKEAAGKELLDSAAGRELPWDGMARGGQRSRDIWTQTVALIDADPLDPRMRAQQGKFLVGGLNRRSSGRRMPRVEAERFSDISTLGVNFLKQRRVGHNSVWPATGWTILIPARWKPHLRKRLSDLAHPITSDSMYPPVNEVARLARFAAFNALVAARSET